MDGWTDGGEWERERGREMREMDERWMRDGWEIDEKCVLCMDFTNIVNSLEILGMFSTGMGVWPYFTTPSWCLATQFGHKKAAEW